jgi:hypothetical protein
MERAHRFEIATRRDGRWTIEATRIRLDESIALANVLLSRKAYEAVRVVRARDVGERTVFETTVYRAERTDDSEPPIKLSGADDRDCWCGDLEDFYGPRSRRAIGSILRDFLDRAGITPTELLHVPRHVRNLEETGPLLPAAVQKAARLTAQSGERGLKASLAFLEATIDEARRRAEASRADRNHPQPGSDGLDAFFERIASRGGEPVDRLHAACHGIARSLEPARTMLVRLDTALVWGRAVRGAPAIQAVDSLLADCLGSAKVVSELLGRQPDLASALDVAIAIARGRPVARPREAAAWYGDFSAFVAAHAAAETRAILLGRVQRALAGDRPLTHGDADAEAAALGAILEALCDDVSGGFVGGEHMVAALAWRWRRLDKPGGFGDLTVPRGTPTERFRDLLDSAGRAHGLMRQRAVATLLIDALRDIPIDARQNINDLRPRIERSGLPEQTIRLLCGEIGEQS